MSDDIALRPPASPEGIALYIRAMAQSTINGRVKRMADHGISWAAIGAAWLEGDGNDLRVMNTADRCHRIIDALLKHGIDPYLWGYPWRGRESQFIDLMSKASTDDVVGWIVDPELGYKTTRLDEEYDEKDEVLAAAQHLFWSCVQANPFRQIGFTSYGMIRGHPTFPWESFAELDGFNPLTECDWHSPQLYDSTPEQIARGLREYREIGADIIVPSYGTYRFDKDENGKTIYPRMSYQELDRHLKRFEFHQRVYSIRAMIGWSEAQVSGGAWRAIAECSERFAEAA